MYTEKKDTIAAIATAQGEGGVAILRVSGEEAEPIMRRAFAPARPFARGKIESHRMYYGHLVNEKGDRLDEVMAVLMRAPRSYTREDVVEIQCHGGDQIVRGALLRALELGAREARPGEFTRRAFENGRVDLSQAEAVMSLVAARSEDSRRAAMRQLEGGVSAFVKDCRNRLNDLMAQIEAANDFPEEIDEDVQAAQVAHKARLLAERIMDRVDERAARIVREGASVVLTGRPNAGKSSLMNALLGAERAIVTSLAGTTRDVLRESVALDGVRITLSDTAGRRQAGDIIEEMGVKKAEEEVKNADVVILVTDGTQSEDPLASEADERYIIVNNKSDLVNRRDGRAGLWVSAATGEGVEELTRQILKKAKGGDPREDMLIQRRHIRLAGEAAQAIQRAAQAIEEGQAMDLAAVDLWEAAGRLSEITGENAAEDVISAVFAQFCVGK